MARTINFCMPWRTDDGINTAATLNAVQGGSKDFSYLHTRQILIFVLLNDMGVNIHDGRILED